MKGKTSITAKERMAAFRKQRLEDGWKQVNIWLSPAAQMALNGTQIRMKNKKIKKTMSDIIEDALLRSGG
jgi:hypothetical protein